MKPLKDVLFFESLGSLHFEILQDFSLADGGLWDLLCSAKYG